MFKLFIIIFRETLEIALLLGIISAATQGTKNRFTYINLGIVLGVLGTLIISVFANKIFESFDGYGQELFTAIILLIAAAMIIWTIIWIKNAHHKTITKLKNHSQITNNSSLISLTIITATAIFREGLEIALFSYSIFASTNENILSLISFGLLGFISAALLGWLMYKGIIQFTGKYLFKITSIMLALIAAGMTAQAANLLASGQLILSYQDPVWDSAWLISQSSFLGKILNILIGYIDNPTRLELGSYFVTLVLIYILSRQKNISTKVGVIK